MAIYNGKVRGGSLNLRQTASTSATVLASIPNNTSLVLETVNGQNAWFKTSYNGENGYVVAQYIAITSGVDTCTVTTASGSLNIRKTPSSGASVIYTAARNSLLYLLDSTSITDWYRVSSSSGTGWAMSSFLTIGGNNTEPPSTNLSVDEYIANLQSFCNCGWTYMPSGCNTNNKTINCAHYPYKARNSQGGKDCTTEYNSYLSSKGLISDLGGYNSLQRGMKVFQQDAGDHSKKSHMGVYAGKIMINGVEYHGVYQSCSSHNTIATVYNNGVPGDSGPNLTEMKNGKWKYWGWSKYVDHA